METQTQNVPQNQKQDPTDHKRRYLQNASKLVKKLHKGIYTTFLWFSIVNVREKVVKVVLGVDIAPPCTIEKSLNHQKLRGERVSLIRPCEAILSVYWECFVVIYVGGAHLGNQTLLFQGVWVELGEIACAVRFAERLVGGVYGDLEWWACWVLVALVLQLVGEVCVEHSQYQEGEEVDPDRNGIEDKELIFLPDNS